ncbi:hypothetical protein ACFLYA_00650 [Candidatus Dependentiae bacterium]
MDFKKNMLTIFMVSLLSSTISHNIYAGQDISIEVETAASTVLVVGSIVALTSTIIGLKTYFSYQKGKKQYEMLKRFMEDPGYTYENLGDDARNLYFLQWIYSSTSLSNDFPVIWLEKDATANKNLLAWMFFSHNLTGLSRELHSVLQYLRNVDRFKEQRKEYNERYREQNYRDERLSIEREKLALQRYPRRFIR